MTTIQALDELIEGTFNESLPPTELLVLQQRIAGYRYRFAEEVSALSKAAMIAEVDRKSIFAKAKLSAKAEAVGTRALGEQAAADTAEQRPEVMRARTTEIWACAEYEAAKMKMQASGDVLNSLQMRIAFARQEARNTQNISTHQHA